MPDFDRAPKVFAVVAGERVPFAVIAESTMVLPPVDVARERVASLYVCRRRPDGWRVGALIPHPPGTRVF